MEGGNLRTRKDTPAKLPTKSKVLLCNQGITLSVDECDDEENYTLEKHNDDDDDAKVPQVFETVFVPKRKTSFLVPRNDTEIRRNSVTFDDSIQIKDTSADNSDTENDEGVYDHLELKDNDSDDDLDEAVSQLSAITSGLAMKVRKDSLKGRGRPPRFRWPGGNMPGTPPSTPVGTPFQDSELTRRVLEQTKEKVSEKP